MIAHVCYVPALWLFYLYSPLTLCKKSEKSLEPFLRKLRYKPTNVNLETFSQISPNQFFFQKSGPVTFLPL